MKEIIENVKQTIAQKQYIMWAYPIVLKLQKYHYNLAIKWAIECIQICSFEIQPINLSKLHKYIQKAIEEQNILTPLQCDEIARELWYSPERDDFQTAIARLWWSIWAFKNEDEQAGIMETVSTVELLLFNTDNQYLLEKFLEAALKICEEYELQNKCVIR